MFYIYHELSELIIHFYNKIVKLNGNILKNLNAHGTGITTSYDARHIIKMFDCGVIYFTPKVDRSLVQYPSHPFKKDGAF